MSKEIVPLIEPSEVPYLGALPHLEWLAGLSIPGGMEARDFMDQTGAAPSFARLIHRNRNRWPSRYIDAYVFDTRQIEMGPDWNGIFSGSVTLAQELPRFVNGEFPSHQILSIYGRPHPGAHFNLDYEYSLTIPVKGTAYRFDDDRPIQASIIRGRSVTQPNFEVQEYNELAADEYRRIPQVLFSAIQYAARDIKKIIDHVHGFDGPGPRMEPAPPELAPYYEDWEADKANEFMDTAPTQAEENKEVWLPGPNSLWHPDYLSDDPDEFRKSGLEC